MQSTRKHARQPQNGSEISSFLRMAQQEPEDRARPLLERAGLRRLLSGNNKVFALDLHEPPICVKLYKADGRNRADREWEALQILSRNCPGLAPEPLWYDAHPEFPVVGMTYIRGKQLNQLHVNDIMLCELANALERIFSIASDHSSYLEARISAVPQCIQRIEQWGENLSAQNHPSWDGHYLDEALRLFRVWRNSGDKQTLSEPVAPVFARGDPNLANCLWHRRKLYLVDFEYAGLSDLAFELADAVEHLNARAVDDKAWAKFVERFIPLGDELYHRFDAARRTLSLLWVMLLWPKRDTMAGTLDKQFERVRFLQEYARG